MYPFVNLPTPLRTLELYVLIALVQSPTHGYGFKKAIHEASLGSITVLDGTLYPLLTRMDNAGLITAQTTENATATGKRTIYCLDKLGRMRLVEEAHRLKRAVDILERADILSQHLPFDIDKFMAARDRRGTIDV